MFKKLLFAALLILAGCTDPARAQNVTCATRPIGDNSNACASTAFVQGSIGTVINVKNAPYNATGNGSTNDSAAFQSAFSDACGTTGVGGAGRAVYVPAGFYRLGTAVTATCGLKVYGDGWPEDSGALLDNKIITTSAAFSGSVLLPDVGVNALTFTTNQAVNLSDFAVVYLSRPAAGSGIIGIKIQAAGAATSPATIAWQEGTLLKHVWLFGADINLAMVNAGQWAMESSHIIMHGTNGVLIQGPNYPYVGAWRVGPNNLFRTAQITNVQHLLSTSSCGGHVHNNTFHSAGSVNVIAPLETSAIALVPILNVAGNQCEPVTIGGNTMEGLSNCILFDGGTPSMNATLSQFAIVGNQGWCIRNVDIRAKSGPAAWVFAGTITGNHWNANTVSGTTTTSNIRIAGGQNIIISSNKFSFVPFTGGDTAAPISFGAAAATNCQEANTIDTGSTGLNAIDATIPICTQGASAGQIQIAQTTTTGSLWKVVSGDATLAATGALTIANNAVTDAKLRDSAANSVIGRATNSSGDPADISTSTDGQVLRLSGTTLGFGALNLASANAITGDLPFANLTQGSALSVLGVTGNATADVASIAAGTDNQVLRRSGTTLAFGAVNLASTNAVTGTLAVGNGGTGITSLGTGMATWWGTPSSANLAATLTDETGSGLAVFNTAPTFSGTVLFNTSPVISFNSGDVTISTATNQLIFNSADNGYVFTSTHATGGTAIGTFNIAQTLGFLTIGISGGNGMNFGCQTTTCFVDNISGSAPITQFRNNVGSAVAEVQAGGFLAGSTQGVGYRTGAGGAVTQITSRTTGVTLNTTSGDITLVSAAGSTSWQSFTVTNSTVAATDTVSVSQKSGTDLNMIHVTAVAAGSFRISFATTGGTTSEQPVFHFNVIKGVSSWLLKRDLAPAANDNTPMFLNKVA